MGLFKIKNEEWKGHNLIKKIAWGIFLGTYIMMFPLLDFIFSTPAVGGYVIMIYFILFVVIYAIDKSQHAKISSQRGGKKMPEGIANLGNGTTEPYQWIVKEVWTVDDASSYLQKKVGQAELLMAKQELDLKEMLNYKDQNGEIINKPLLTKKEIEDLEYYAIVESSQYKNETKDFKREYISEKLMQRFYELDTNNEPTTLDPETKQEHLNEEYLEWRQENTPLQTYILKEIQTQITQLDNQNKEDYRKHRIWNIASHIAKFWNKRQIKSAKVDGPEGGAIHGYLQRFDDYKTLVKKDYVLDKALEIVEASTMPTIYGLVENNEISKCVRNVVFLMDEQHFDAEPDLKFNMVIWYSRRPFENALDWKEGVPKTVGNYPNIPMTSGSANINILARIQHNIPLAHTAHAPGKDGYVKSFDYNKVDIGEEIQRIKNDMLQEKENEVIKLKDKADDFEGKTRTWREIATKYKDALEDLTPKKANDIITQAKKQVKTTQVESQSKKKIAKWIAYALGVVGVVVFLLFIINGIPSGGVNTLNSTL